MKNKISQIKENWILLKKHFVFLFFIGVVTITIFSQIRTRVDEKLENRPNDYETHGEDVAWETWLKRDFDAYQSIRANWEKASADYRNSMLNISISGAGRVRDSLFAQKNNSEFSAQMINGNKTSTGIRYTQNDVKAGGVKLSNIKSILIEGFIEGITVVDGKILLSVVKAENNQTGDNYPDDFLVLMKSVFESNDGGPWLTIDPPQNPALQKHYGEVKYSSFIKNTRVGAVLFEADRLMKILGLGYDNRNGRKLNMPAWHKTSFDYHDFGDHGKQEWHRFWFTSDDTVVIFDAQNKTARIQGRPFTIKTEEMTMVNGKLQTTLVQNLSSPAGKWCDFFDKNIESYYRQFPVFLELEKIVRITAILQGLKECGVIFQNISIPETVAKGTPSSSKTAVLSVSRIQTTTTETRNSMSTVERTISLTGGVGLQQVKLIKGNLSSYKNQMSSDYNSGKKTVERIF